MSEKNSPLAVDTAVSTAQRILASRFGGTPELSNVEDLGGNGSSLVLRARVASNDFLPERTVVIKQLPSDSAEQKDADSESEDLFQPVGSRRPSFDRIGLFRELVAYQFTNTLAEKHRPGPQLLAYDLDKRMLILSDLGEGKNFDEVLNQMDEQDRLVALRKLGRALGRMHVATAGKEEAYNTLFRRRCQVRGLDPQEVDNQQFDIAHTIDTGIDLVKGNNIPVHLEVVRLAKLAAERQKDGLALAFTPVDLMPDNIVLTKRVYFLDYEWAGFRDIAFDVACIIAGFPQDLSTPALTDAECSEFLDAWRAEAVAEWPEFREDEHLNEVVLASLIGWAFFSLSLLYYGSEQMAELREFDIEIDDINKLTTAQLIDLATTVEAIFRFASRAGTQRYQAVVELSEDLLAALASMGAHPNQREE